MFRVAWWKLGLLLGIGSWMIASLGPHHPGTALMTHRMSRSLATFPPVNLHPKTVTPEPSAQKPESRKPKPGAVPQAHSDSPPPGVWRAIQNSSHVTAIVFTPDRRTLICACQPPRSSLWPPPYSLPTTSPSSGILPILGSLNFWNLRTGKLTRQVLFHTQCNALAISPDGKTLVGSCIDYTRPDPHWHSAPEPQFRVWNALTGKLEHSIMPRSGGEITFSHDGKSLAVGEGLDVWLMDTRAWRTTRILSGPHRWLRFSVGFGNLTFSSNDNYVAASSWAGDAGVGNLAVWNTHTGRLVRSIGESIHGLPVEDAYKVDGPLVFVPHSDILLCGIYQLDLRQPHRRLKSLFKQNAHFVYAVTTAHHRIRVISTVDDSSRFPQRTLALWDSRRKKPVRIWRDVEATDWSMQFSADGRLLANVNDTEVDLWRIR